MTRSENPFKRNFTWAIHYDTMPRESCVEQCKKMNHDLPSIQYIEHAMLENVKKATDLKCRKNIILYYNIINII